MLDGITVISSYTVSPIILIVLGIIFLVLGFIGIFVFDSDEVKPKLRSVMEIVTIFLIAVGVTLFVEVYQDRNCSNTYYKVTISDEVKFNDFEERYDIVTSKGEIYTIREKLNNPPAEKTKEIK